MGKFPDLFGICGNAVGTWGINIDEVPQCGGDVGIKGTDGMGNLALQSLMPA